MLLEIENEVYKAKEEEEVIEGDDEDVADRIETLEMENTYLKEQLYRLRKFIPNPGDPLGGS